MVASTDTRRRWFRWRPLRIAAAFSLVGAVVPLVMHPAARAAGSEPPTPGVGTAAAYVLNVGEQVGGAGIGLATFVKAFAKYADTTGHGEAQFYDPGILVLVASLQECNSYAINPSSLPHAIIADTNESGGKPVAQTQSTAGNSGQGAGTSSVSASPNSDGRGDGTGGAASFPGLFQMTGGAVHTGASWDPAHLVRTVTAESDVGHLSLLNIVELGGMKWTAQEVVSGLDSRTSKASPPTTSFSLGSARLLGVPLPTGTPDQAAAAIKAINAVAGPLGLTITLPTVVRNAAGIEVTPLVASLRGNSALQAVLGPVYTAKDPNGNLLVNDVENLLKPGVFDPKNCNELFGLLKSQPQLNAGWNQLGAGYPIILGATVAALAGAGSVDVNVGDVKVSVDDTYFAPINFGGLNFGTSNLGATPGIAGTPGTPGIAGTPAASVGGLPAAPQLASSTPGALIQRAGRNHCETTSPFGHPMCWGGHGPIAAGAALALAIALFGGDEILRRRRAVATTTKKEAS